MSVEVTGWSAQQASAVVDGVNVRVTRYPNRVAWRCDEHGTTTNHPGCEHTQALAATPAQEADRSTP